MPTNDEAQTKDVGTAAAEQDGRDAIPPATSRWLRFFPRRKSGEERRSGHDRRGTSFEKRRQSFYRTLFRIKPHFADVDPDPRSPMPVPAAVLSDDRKVTVLLALHDNVRKSIHEWENRIFQAFLLSEGALLSAVAYFLDHADMHRQRQMFGAAVAIFGAAALAYLYLAAKAHANNGTLLVKLEAALGLCEPGTYIKDAPFFGYTGFWVEDWRTPILLVIHLAVSVFATYAVLSGLT